MRSDFVNGLASLRNQLAHSPHDFDGARVAEGLAQLGISVPASEAIPLAFRLASAAKARADLMATPLVVLQALIELLNGRSARLVCDPCAGLGTVIAAIQDATRAPHAIAITGNSDDAVTGKLVAPHADWQVGDSLHLLQQLSGPIDVAASMLPFGSNGNRMVLASAPNGEDIEVKADLSGVILVAAVQKLAPDGLGLFVVAPSFFWSSRSALVHFEALGLGVQAAFELPAGTFAPRTNLASYLVVVGWGAITKMFVARLSTDPNTNTQVFDNFRRSTEGDTVQLGRLVAPNSFKGLGAIRMVEELDEAGRRYGAQPLPLGELATTINLGRTGETFDFPLVENPIFIPLLGTSDVIDSNSGLKLKKQNYAQVGIDPARSDSRFVAQFLNSELGRTLRESSKAGVIPKFNAQSIRQLLVFVPDLQTQHDMLEMEAAIATQQNTLSGLQNELSDLRRQLWADPHGGGDTKLRLRSLANRLGSGLSREAEQSLDQWFETLPFPLASILRAWQATPSQDYKTRYEHLLHFFEAAAEFLSVILLSAFGSRELLFAQHIERIQETLQKQHLSFERATFGTWKVALEYLSRQTRQLLEGDSDARALCADIFADTTLALPQMLARRELASVLSEANKMRNDWTGHGGVVGQTEAQLRNGLLVAALQRTRKAMADAWTGVELIQALNCRPRRGVFENEISILTGSNSEFLKETRSMARWMDVERIYLTRRHSPQALELFPLVQIGPSPTSAKNACYFFNRVEKNGVRWISYHFIDSPERLSPFEDSQPAMPFFPAPPRS